METDNQNVQKTQLCNYLPERVHSEGRRKLMSWLNQQMKVNLIDGRILVGTFVCTDKDAHIILSTCYEYFNEKDLDTGESRLLGLVMIPGRHIVSIHTDVQQINEQPINASNFEEII
ncbi:N-alpha-acetyltransferase 38, NatC auxiliary subunit [Rhopalosiphum maidis]|uniref:N-alpha-acetyltransferase 38, NatC auxiliary subunit n=1 Tax=Rhopalosiphum maidis TaxID=43146 RepID=UPI000EFEF93B|nr:N-alpha-acetyltransferase 38, NatC auxiliary subunit [Rhopalosiphum maidis]XP_060835343.1 N-alpha-acetyltransferase 38, NatC auxiliary subunit [Rhopalosiphum padi]